MLRKLFLSSVILFVLLSLCFGVSVEADSSVWSKTYGGPYYDYAFSLVETVDGYAIAGYTESFGAGEYDFWLVKADADGNMEWNKTYGGTENDIALSLVKTSDGGYVLAGYTLSFGAGEYDFWLVKTDVDGNEVWNRTYGGEIGDYAKSLVLTSDGGYAIAGDTWSFGAGYADFWLVKTDVDGNEVWNRTYGGPNYDYAYSLVEIDNGYVVAGGTESFGVGSRDVWLIKTDENGSMEWNQTYGGSGDDYAISLVENVDGYVVAGGTDSFGAGNKDIWLIKTDVNGTMEWNQTYGGPNGDYAYLLVETSDGGYAIAGSTNSFDGDGDAWLIKTDAYGTMEWNQTYGGTEADRVISLVVTSDGGYAMAGYTESFGVGLTDSWLIKTDETGFVPEYSSWLLPTLLLTATLVVVVCKKKLMKKQTSDI